MCLCSRHSAPRHLLCLYWTIACRGRTTVCVAFTTLVLSVDLILWTATCLHRIKPARALPASYQSHCCRMTLLFAVLRRMFYFCGNPYWHFGFTFASLLCICDFCGFWQVACRLCGVEVPCSMSIDWLVDRSVVMVFVSVVCSQGVCSPVCCRSTDIDPCLMKGVIVVADVNACRVNSLIRSGSTYSHASNRRFLLPPTSRCQLLSLLETPPLSDWL